MNGKPVCEITCAEVSPLREEALFRRWLERMPEFRKRKILELRHAESQRLSLGVGILLFQAMERHGLRGNGEIAEEVYGRPYLPGHPEFRFSLSHAGLWAVCAAGSVPVGCDVERAGRGQPRLVRRFFHRAEQEALAEKEDPAEWDRLFTRIWTRKESYLKATGRGLSIPMNSFSVLDPPSGVLYDEQDLAEGYAFSCCALADEVRFEWKTVRFPETPENG